MRGHISLLVPTCSSLLIVTFLQAFMTEVPFATEPDVPKLTRKLCEDSLRVALFSSPVSGTNWCWRDSQGNIQSVHIVADCSWDRLVYWRDGRSAIRTFGGNDGGASQLSFPGGLDMDGFGRVFVADRWNSRIMRLSYDFSAETIATVAAIESAGAVRFQYPKDVRLDDAGTPVDSSDDRLWIADPELRAVYRLDLASQEVTAEYGDDQPSISECLREPVGVAVGQVDGANTNDVYVIDEMLHGVVRLQDSLGCIVWRAFSGLPGRTLAHICTDYLGYVYVTDSRNSQIVRLDRNLENLEVYGSQGTDYGHLDHPCCFHVVRNTLQGFVIERWADSSGIRMYTLSGGIAGVQLPDSVFDATCESLPISFQMNSPALVAARVTWSGGEKLIQSQVALDTGHFTLYWSGEDDSGRLELPGDYRVTVEAQGTGSLLWMDSKSRVCTIKGTQVYSSENGEWTSAADPYVLTGNVTVGSGSSLRIDSGVRVMPRGNQSITVAGRLVARGTSGQPVLFSPYRRLSPTADTCSAGRWQGIRIANYSGALCSLDHCIIEYAGNPGTSSDSAVIHGNQEDWLAQPDPASVLARSLASAMGSRAFICNATSALGLRARVRTDYRNDCLDTCTLELTARKTMRFRDGDLVSGRLVGIRGAMKCLTRASRVARLEGESGLAATMRRVSAADSMESRPR